MRNLWLLPVLLLVSCHPVTQKAEDFTVFFHPDGHLYVGDQVSIEVIPPPGLDTQEKQIQVTLGDQVLGQSGFSPFGVGERTEAILWWIWDTAELPQGDQTLTFRILPGGSEWQETVHLDPVEENPYSSATWETTTSDCCLIHYITGTDAEKDLKILTGMVDAQAQNVSARMQADLDQPVSITFLPRLLGHGGFSSNGIYVTYMESNYAGNITEQVIHHELVHVLDANLGGEYLPPILVEGLAVYLSGGHYKPEPLILRAAALPDLGDYIPLRELAQDFYKHQHEIGYLEAGALVEYLVGKYGWDSYESFYRHISNSGNPVDSLEAALERNFGISLDQLDQDLQSVLHAQEPGKSVREDLRLTILFYDDLRRYQQELDPSAYFLTAWLPDGQTMREKGIVADFLRGPNRVENRFMEFMLLKANKDLSAGDFNRADLKLYWIDRLLNFYTKWHGSPDGSQ